ncbi:PD-(D/E)XK nuclease family protein [Herpetosiphon llansteffanensis]
MQAISAMLQAFAKLPPQPTTTPTFLEIAGYPHLENVASNILAFYLQSTNQHNLGNLLFRALMQLVDRDIQGDYPVTARREDVTAGNKRIDLVIETPEFIIGIENKIYHQLDNDLAIYHNHLKALANGRTVYGFVLALHSVKLPAESYFKSISYKQLFASVESLWHVAEHANSDKYIGFFHDFSETLLNLSRGTTMSAERLAFFQSNRQEIQELLNETKALRNEMRTKLTQLAMLIQPEDTPKKLKQGFWSPDNELFEILHYEIVLNDQASLQIDIILNVQGWHMQFFNRRGDKASIQAWIDQRNIAYELQSKPLWRLRLAQAEILPYNAELGTVAEWVLGIIRRLLPTQQSF